MTVTRTARMGAWRWPAGAVALTAAAILASPAIPAAAQPGSSHPGPAAAAGRHHAARTGHGSHDWLAVSAGGYNTCGIRASHTLWCWGNNLFGQLGIGGTDQQSTPQQVTAPMRAGWMAVTVGSGHVCAIRTGRTLWCWGSGGLGIASTADQTTPQQVTSPAASGWVSVAAGGDHTCGIRTDHTLWCWGDNGHSALGIGSDLSQDTPQRVTAPAVTGWSAVSAGDSDTCAISTLRTLWCWGWNDFGQLGIGSHGPDQSRPQQVTIPAATGWYTVTAAALHTCATRGHRALWCWGDNASGAIGIGSTGDNPDTATPQRVTGPADSGWGDIAAGDDHTCGTRGHHALWCWGDNSSGELGLGDNPFPNTATPQRVSTPAATGWVSVTAGAVHTCAIRTDRTLWCWGGDDYGDLGLGGTGRQSLPQRVRG